MEYIRLTKDNIENEHICCAISNNRDVPRFRDCAKQRQKIFADNNGMDI